MMNSTKQQKVVPMLPIKNIRSFLSLCDESFVDDMIGYMIMVEDMELKLPENLNEVSLKEEANALVCYAIFKGLLQEFHKKNKLVDDNTIDNILDDSHYYIYNWLIMKFSVPAPLYAMIVHHANTYLESNSWDKSNPFANFQYNYQMNSYKSEDNNEEFQDALYFVSNSLEK